MRRAMTVTAVATVLVLATQAGAQRWIHDPAEPGDWYVGANWSTGSPPAGNTVIDNGGTVNLGSGSPLLSGDLRVGGSDTGRTDQTGHLVQTGGALSFYSSARMYVQSNAPTAATYELRDGTISMGNGDVLIGGGTGAARFIQTGGQFTSLQPYAQWSITSGGSYELSGTGSFTTSRLVVGTGGQVAQNGGTASPTSLQVFAGSLAAPTGYVLNSGQLTAGGISVGDASSSMKGGMTQTGGTVNASGMAIASTGAYRLAGGLLQINGYLVNQGTLDFAGGAGTLALGEQGWAEFSASAPLNTGAATLTGGSNSVVVCPAGYDPNAAFAHFNTTGLIYRLGQDFVIPADRSITVQQRQQIKDHVRCSGSLVNIWPTATLQLLNGVEVSGTGQVTAGNNNGTYDIYVNDSTSGISGGSLSGTMVIGSAGKTGAFTQTGGTYNVGSNGLLVGGETGGTGHYAMSGSSTLDTWGGNLSVGANGGTGTFVQDGGTVQLRTGDLIVRGNAVAGRYTMNAGRIEGRVLAYNSLGAVATFEQNGGDIVGTVVLGWSVTGGAGAYVKTGGTVSGVTVGSFQPGSFRQTGGTTTGSITVMGQSGGYGTCLLEGGVVRVSTLAADPAGVSTPSGPDTLGLWAPVSLTISSSFYLGARSAFTAEPGAAVHMAGASFDNHSTDPAALAGLGNLTMVFEGGSSQFATLETGGRDLGAANAGMTANFALAGLRVGGTNVAKVRLADATDNQPAWTGKDALYVGTLALGPGSTLDLNGLHLYYDSGTIDPNATVILNGGSLTRIPEPATLALLALGGLAVIRKRQK
ncbi:MAG: PEP-CTERM sorting domain-containing protein [Planctomycetota bacterium]|nr:PEP-CTERM sorting domain-containing protein [Planctomycetota bacterium]